MVLTCARTNGVEWPGAQCRSSKPPTPCSPSKLSTLLNALEYVLAVLSLDLPPARALLTRLVLDPAAVPQTQAAFSDILAEWHTAGIAC